MNANYRLKTLVTILIVSLVAASCAARGAYKKGTQAEISKDYETAMEQYRQALAADPGNVAYRLKYEQTRFSAAFVHFQNGRRALDAGDAVKAKAEFQRAADIDPTHDFARQEMQDVDRLLAARAQSKAEPALDFLKMTEATKTDANLGATLKTTLKDRITVKTTGTMRQIYENVAGAAGLQVIFGRNPRQTNATIELTDVNLFEALDIVALQTTTFWQPVNETTIMVMEDNQQNRRDFEDHIMKTIYLTNVTTTNDLNQILNVLRTALSLRGIFQYEPGNAIVIHDTPARVAMAERVIKALDKAKSEVLIDVTIMEVDRSTVRDLGINLPTDTVVGFNPLRGPANSNEVSFKDLDKMGSGNFSVTVNDSVAKFLAQHSNASLLQNPRIRTMDGVTAQLRVGSEVPVPTTSFQNTTLGGGAQTSYTFQQVGVTLDILSRVLLNREIFLQVTATVRALSGERAVGTINIPVFSNRQVAHTIRLTEGETNILAGIISESEGESMTGIPGLKNVPLLKYLFGQEHKTKDKAEVIIMLTPHIVRMPDITEEDIRSVIVGGENNLKLRPDYGSPVPAVAPPQPARPAAPPTSAAPIAPPAPTTAALTFAAPVTLTPQGETEVKLAINGPNILGTDLKLAFDPSAFTIKDVHDGGFLSQNGQVIALVHNIDNTKGIATVTLERPSNAPLVSGNGTLISLMLQAGAKKGASPLKVTEFGVRDQRSALHPGAATEVQVTVP
jgi:general secretion pathway protein D